MVTMFESPCPQGAKNARGTTLNNCNESKLGIGLFFDNEP